MGKHGVPYVSPLQEIEENIIKFISHMIQTNNAPSMEQIIKALANASDEQKTHTFNILTGADVNINKQTDKLVTKTEACEVLHCSPAKLDRLVKAGKLVKIQLFGKHSKNLFKLSELKTLIDSSKTTLQPIKQEALV